MKITEHFKSGADGFTNGDTPIIWSPHGGDGGGYVSVTTDSFESDFVTLSNAFSGDLSSFFHGTLSYDVKSNEHDVKAASTFDVEIIGDPDEETIDATVGEPGKDWTHLSVALSSSVHWELDHSPGLYATDDQIKAILADVEEISVRADYGSKPGEVVGFDNFSLRTHNSAAPAGQFQQEIAQHLNVGEAFLALNQAHHAIA